MSFGGRLRVASIAAIVAVGLPLSVAGAQVSMRATTASLTVDEGMVVTAVFALTNAARDSVTLRTTLELPKGWVNVAGFAPHSLAGGATDTWIAGITVPASAAAGRYVVRGGVSAGMRTASDSVVVIVGERRSLEVLPVETPRWAVMGSPYQAVFLVRNRGNVSSSLTFTGTTSRGARASATPPSATLAPGASTRVTIAVQSPARAERAMDDVIEIAVVDPRDTSATVMASTRTTLVPNGGSTHQFESVPATIALRSTSGTAGVAPAVLSGAGTINGTNTRVDFLLQAPTNERGPVGFGERDEYRLSVQSPHFGLRLGDHVYGWSMLTSTGSLGTGGELRGTLGGVEAGAYVQRPRWSPSTRSEEGASIGVGSDSIGHIAATGLLRQPLSGSAVRAGGLTGNLRLSPFLTLEADGAMSDSGAARGNAFHARIAGSSPRISYEAGTMRASAAFAGPLGGNITDGASISTKLSEALTFSANAHRNAWTARTVTERTSVQKMTTASGELSWKGATTLQYGWLSRKDADASLGNDGVQQGVRLTTSRKVLGAMITAGAERGIVSRTGSDSSGSYVQALLSMNAEAGAHGSFGITTTFNRGVTLTGATNGVLDFGVNATLKLPFGLSFAVAGSARRAELGVLDSSGAWFSVMDASLGRTFSNGATLGIHARTLQSPYASDKRNSSAMYLEYRAPLHVPVVRASQKGRVVGRVTNADDHTPVAGVLVRLGTEAAVTDNNGRVRFSGVDAALHRVSIEATGAAAGAMLTGDVVVDTRGQSSKPTEFSVQVARGAHVTASVRSFSRTGTLGAAADTLVEAGALADVVVKLAGARDTLYQATDDQGRVDFGNVVPGSYVLTVRASDAPEGAKFENERLELTLAAGEQQAAKFRTIPRPRAVRILDGAAAPVLKAPGSK